MTIPSHVHSLLSVQLDDLPQWRRNRLWVAGVATATSNLCERPLLCFSDEAAISGLIVFLATPLEIIFLLHCTSNQITITTDTAGRYMIIIIVTAWIIIGPPAFLSFGTIPP